MAFDPSRLDWALGGPPDAASAVYGDDWGDRSPSSLLDAWQAAQARRWADAPVDAARQVQAAAFVARHEQRARKRHSALAERAYLREQRLQAKARAAAGARLFARTTLAGEGARRGRLPVAIRQRAGLRFGR